MVKILGISFATLLVCAHVADVQGDAYERPLSLFRDYEPAWMGYAMFGLLVLIGLETVRTAFRAQTEVHAAIYLFSTALLGVVAATPSENEWHQNFAVVVMLAMFIYYAVVLYFRDSLFWLVFHLLTPSFMMFATRLDSYGIWQKGMILYFLAATIVHQGVLAQQIPKRRRVRRTKVKVRVGLKQSTPAPSYLTE
jgi:hypothetical protein